MRPAPTMRVLKSLFPTPVQERYAVSTGEASSDVVIRFRYPKGQFCDSCVHLLRTNSPNNPSFRNKAHIILSIMDGSQEICRNKKRPDYYRRTSEQ